MKKLIFSCVIFLTALSAQGQVLISLLLGDKFNTGKIEFGLDGGINFMTLPGVTGSSSNHGFNLGFYFDIKTKSRYLIQPALTKKY